MNGLSTYERDLDLPCTLGEPHLSLPRPAELLDCLTRTLLSDGAPVPRSAEVIHVRYKPGVSVTGTYAIRFDGDIERAVTLKIHPGKATVDPLLRSARLGQALELCWPLLPQARSREGWMLWTHPTDPELPGLLRAMDMRRMARWIDGLGICAPMVVRLRPSKIDLHRYKFARRAVFCVTAKLRGDREERSIRHFGLRVLPPAVASEVASQRMDLRRAGTRVRIPNLFAHDHDAGLLLEEWLPGAACSRSDFGHAAEILGRAAELHRTPPTHPKLAGPGKERWIGASTDWPGELFDPLDDRLRELVLCPDSAWVHGDLHPDQLLMDGDRASLLDLDNVRLGSPEEDVATYAADWIAQSQASDPPDIVRRCHSLYAAAGGTSLDDERLGRLTSIALVGQAAGSLRRLEVGALDHSRRLVAAAEATLRVQR